MNFKDSRTHCWIEGLNESMHFICKASVDHTSVDDETMKEKQAWQSEVKNISAELDVKLKEYNSYVIEWMKQKQVSGSVKQLNQIKPHFKRTDANDKTSLDILLGCIKSLNI